MHQRINMLSSITINIPNNLQNGGQPFNVLMTSAQIITNHQGGQVGPPVQQQQPLIASDLAPEVLSAINAQLQYLGFALTPIDVKEVAVDA